MTTLTDTQQAVLTFMRAYLAENDTLPSMSAISSQFGWGSRTAAYNHLQALLKKNKLEKIGNRYRLGRVPVS